MSAPERVGRGGRSSWKRFLLWMFGGLCLEAGAAVAGLCVGSTGLGVGRLFEIAMGADPTASESMILWFARLPRVWFAAIVGSALASAGVVFQALLRNPLADPYILGVSGGGALCATLYLAIGAGVLGGTFGVSVAALLGAGLSVLGLLLAARWMGDGGRMSVYVLLLLGVVFNAFASAVITLVKAVVSAQKAQELLFYLMGSLSVEGSSWELMAAASVAVALAIGVMVWLSRDFNVLALGDEAAHSLGVEVDRVRLVGVLAASVAVGVAVAYTGLIGFVGLVVPHGLRLVVGPDHRLLLPLSAVCGAAFLTASDVVARASFDWFSMTLPVGVVTSLVGAPLFVLVLRRSMRGRHRGGVR